MYRCSELTQISKTKGKNNYSCLNQLLISSLHCLFQIESSKQISFSVFTPVFPFHFDLVKHSSVMMIISNLLVAVTFLILVSLVIFNLLRK